jgi:S1-C subfamily serine protease
VVVAEDAYFMGFPFNAPDVVAYKGMISARFSLQTGALKGKAIVTDTLHIEAPIARGFSGAPLLRPSDDTVVGVVTNRLGGISPVLNEVAEQIVKGRSAQFRLLLRRFAYQRKD